MTLGIRATLDHGRPRHMRPSVEVAVAPMAALLGGQVAESLSAYLATQAAARARLAGPDVAYVHLLGRTAVAAVYGLACIGNPMQKRQASVFFFHLHPVPLHRLIGLVKPLGGGEDGAGDVSLFDGHAVP